MALDVEVLLFDGFDELDAVGPYEVLANGAREGAEVAVRTVARRGTEPVEASHGLTVVPDSTPSEPGEPDLLVVPGGGWSDGGGGVRAVVDEGALPDMVAAHHAAGGTVASVCTGAMILVEAGVLDDRPATTHHVAHDDLGAVADRVDARVVDDGDVVTAGGVTSGIDLGLWLLECEFGANLADAVARRMEYERRGEVHRTADG